MKILKVTKSDCYFNRYGSCLCRNKAQLSVSQILFVAVTKSFFASKLVKLHL